MRSFIVQELAGSRGRYRGNEFDLVVAGGLARQIKYSGTSKSSVAPLAPEWVANRGNWVRRVPLPSSHSNVPMKRDEKDRVIH